MTRWAAWRRFVLQTTHRRRINITTKTSNVLERHNYFSGAAQLYVPDEMNRVKERVIRANRLVNGQEQAYEFSHEIYTYDAMSRLSLTDRLEDGRRDFFFYMDTGELNQAFYGTPSYGQGGPWTAQRYAQYYLDRAGNRYGVDDNGTPTTFTPNALNQYAQTSNGSEHEIAAYNSVTYRYLGDTFLAEVNAPGQNYKLGYDALGRCVRRETNGQVAYSAYDGAHSILEYNSAGAITVTTLYGLGIDEIIARGNNGEGQFLHQDRLGNTTAVLNIAGEVIEQYRYDAFGQPAIKDASGAPRTQTAINNRVLFTGREWVPQFNIYEYRNRAYHPGLGRFMSEDPMGFKAGDRNLFRYCGGDPVNRTDPTGLVDTNNQKDWLWEFAKHTDSGNSQQGLFIGYMSRSSDNEGGGRGNDNAKFYGGVNGFERSQGLRADAAAVGQAAFADTREDVNQEANNVLHGSGERRYARERSTAEYVEGGRLVKSGPDIGPNQQYNPHAFIPDPPKGSGISPRSLILGTHGHGPGSGRTFQREDIRSANGAYGRSYISAVGSVLDNGARVHVYVPYGRDRYFYTDDGRSFYLDQ